MSGNGLVVLSAIINNMLRKTGIQVVRAETLDALVATREKYASLTSAAQREPAVPGQSATDLASRISALEARTEASIHGAIRYAMKAHWRTVDLIEQLSGADKPAVCQLCGEAPGAEGFEEIVSQCVFLGGRLLRHKCPHCDVVFGPQKMFALDAEMLDLDYRNLYRIYSEGNSTASVIRTFHLLNPVKGGTYLDFGCGGEWSEAIERLRADGWDVYGFEPSAGRSSACVYSDWAEIEGRQFNGILTHNVLEHLFDPIGTTGKLGRLLVPGGRLVHATPCFDYRYDFTHYHVFFFTGRSPEVMASRAGMKIIDWVRDGEYVACTLGRADL